MNFRVIASVFLLAGTLSAAPGLAAPVFFPGNGHHYEYVPVSTTWSGARTAAATFTFLGLPGHLATVTTSAENTFLTTSFGTSEPTFFAWLAGYEPGDDGVWLWGAGPENGVQFSSGVHSTPPYNYANWGGIEPNDNAPGEDFCAINLGNIFAAIPQGAWGDAPNPGPNDPIHGYIVEYETTTSGVERNAPTVDRLWLGQGSPNPFRATSRVDYSHGNTERVDIEVFDVRGREVRSLRSGPEPAGRYSITWDGMTDTGDLSPPGIYFLLVRTGSQAARQKLLLVK